MSRTKGHFPNKWERQIWNFRECAKNAAGQITESYSKSHNKTKIPKVFIM